MDEIGCISIQDNPLEKGINPDILTQFLTYYLPITGIGHELKSCIFQEHYNEIKHKQPLPVLNLTC